MSDWLLVLLLLIWAALWLLAVYWQARTESRGRRRDDPGATLPP